MPAPHTLALFMLAPGLPVNPVYASIAQYLLFILLGVDQLMDMARTSVNVLGNCLATVVVARWEGDYKGAQAVSPTLQTGAGALPEA